MSKKIAIVTGAAKGIGKAIVTRLHEEGFFVVALDLDEPNGNKLKAELGKENIDFIKADISKQKEVVDLFAHLMNTYKQIDVLVNNAGIIKDNMIWNMPEEDFNSVVDVNLKGVWLMCKEAAKIMRQQKSGRIVNIASRAWLGNRGQSNYAASKAGVVALTRVLALELGKYNVLVNAIAPGLIDTPLTEKLEKEVLPN
ncbi:MAG: SDR family oxidoreductase [Bacteroidia bacterium]